MNPDLDFDPSQYTRLPPYLDNATTVALGRQLVAAASGIVAPAVKKSTSVVSRATQKLADGMAELVGLDAPQQKRPIDQAADHSWAGLQLRLLGWLELPAADHPEVAEAQALHAKLFPNGLRFTQLEYGAQWAEAEARLSWLKGAGQLGVLERLCGKPFVAELLRAHAAYAEMVGTDAKKRATLASRPDLTQLRKAAQKAMLAHQIQLVALLMSGEAVQQAEKALRPLDDYREKLMPQKPAKKEDPSPAPETPDLAPAGA